MADQANDQYETRLALAALTACIVKTLSESDAAFLHRFQSHLDDAYSKIRDAGANHLGALETLKNVRELLK